MPRRRLSTGNAEADAKDDFDLARQREVLSRLSRWVRGQPTGVNAILPFDEVVAALGRTGERDLGLQPVRLDSIVGTVDRTDGAFDRDFRPTSTKSRERWVRSATAMRRGEPLEPITVYRVGEAHFVRDGHHRVSVAKAAGLEVVDAFVTEVLTRAGASADLRVTDLPVKAETDTDANAYLGLADARYRLLRTHSGDAEVIDKRRGRVGVRNSIVEGEPGIFPDPIARLFVAFSRWVRRRTSPPEPEAPEARQPSESEAPPTSPASPPAADGG